MSPFRKNLMTLWMRYKTKNLIKQKSYAMNCSKSFLKIIVN